MRSRVGAGIIAGSVAGLVMAMAMMGYMRWRGESVWTNPDLIAAMWMGPEVADGRLTTATLVGFVMHMATSALVTSLSFIHKLPGAWLNLSTTKICDGVSHVRELTLWRLR